MTLLHDLSITAAQAAYMGEWVAQEGADVLLALDHGVLLVGQGDDRFLINPDGSEHAPCVECARPAVAHLEETLGHEYEPVPEETETCPECGLNVADDGHMPDCPIAKSFVPLGAALALHARELIDPDYDPAATDDDGVPLFSAETQAESEPPTPDRESEAGGRGTTPSSSASGKDRSPTDVSRLSALDDPRGEADR